MAKYDIPGFPKYAEDDLKKVNAMREANSQPRSAELPILPDSAVMFTRASEMGNEPASCYNCHFLNERDMTCMLIGPAVRVEKLTHKGIEYWPCCGMQDYGEPNDEKPCYCANNSPDTLGLIWINAPKVGQKCGGANCSGTEGGDDCDHYMVEKGDKRENPVGFCRVLQHNVAGGDVCTAWMDDDQLPWQRAMSLIEPEKKSFAKSLIGRDS